MGASEMDVRANTSHVSASVEVCLARTRHVRRPIRQGPRDVFTTSKMQLPPTMLDVY